MKRILLCFTLLTFGFTGSNGQSFEITPSDGFLKSASPDLELRGTGNPQLRGKRSRGTLSSPTPVTNGSSLLELFGAGYTSGFYWDQALIRMSATEDWSFTDSGTRIGFFTTENGSTTLTEQMTLSDKGYLGLNTANSNVPFHVNRWFNGYNSATAISIFGLLDGLHLNFNGDQINSWDNTSGSELFLNHTSNGRVIIGNNGPNAGLDVQGYTRLGTSSPKIKIKKLTGTTSATAGTADIAHGIGDSDKILSVDISINNAGKTYVSENYTQSANLEFNYYYNDTNIGVVTKSGNSAFLNSRPIKVLITYEE